MPTLDKAGILSTILHRPPILLVDEVLDWKKLSSLHAKRFFPKDDPVFNGHFPDMPILPGVLGIEALAQSAALLVNLSYGYTSKNTSFLFMRVEDARFKKIVNPEDTLELRVSLERQKNDIYWFSGKASVDGDICTEAKFTAKLILEDKE
ncbi:MAG: 3-hydroxyacyl-ACP dehydratase FabZ [Alphaproteobacteria bacterium]|nr:3-hydroxyacyl-ACP dehydratase FabZ [Alphaproteobacteria bacterium]MDD9920396.1 3-hydroxyacyl-ACP dehydratase FabZ [Alphaproteobacteria bacterium]